MKTIIKIEKKTRDHKSVKEKIEIVQYAIQNSNRRAEDKYGVGRQSIRNWRDKLPELLAISNKSHKSTLHPGRKPETVDIENEIVEWILMNRSRGVSISSWEVIIKACSLKPELNQKSIGILKNGDISSWKDIFSPFVQVLILARNFQTLIQKKWEFLQNSMKI